LSRHPGYNVRDRYKVPAYSATPFATLHHQPTPSHHLPMATFFDADDLHALESGMGEWTNVQSPVRRMLLTMATALEEVRGGVASSGSGLSLASATTSATSKKAASVWREIAAVRDDLSTRATRVEVHESLQLKADRSSVHRLRVEGEAARVNMLRNMLEEQRDVHLKRHDIMIRTEMDALGAHIKNLSDQFHATQFENRFEGLETRVTEYGKRRRRTANKLAKLVADVRALNTHGAESSSLFLSGVARLRETLEGFSIQLAHKADGTELRKGLESKADQAEVDTLRHTLSAKSLQERFSALELRISEAKDRGLQEVQSSVDLGRSVGTLRAEVQHLATTVNKELDRVKSTMDIVQQQNTELHHSEASLQASSERSSAQLSRRLVQVEEILERHKPRLHDLGRQIDRATKANESISDKLDGVAKAQKHLSSTQVASLMRDTDRLKKTIVHMERKEAASGASKSSGSAGGSAGARHNDPRMASFSESLSALRSSSRDTEDRVCDLGGMLKDIRGQMEEQSVLTDRALQKAAEERNAIDNRCSALEIGVRHSLTVLSRPPSVKSISLAHNDDNSSKHHRHHRHQHRREKGEQAMQTGDGGLVHDENMDAVSESGSSASRRRTHRHRSRRGSKAGSRRSRRSSRPRSRHDVAEEEEEIDAPGRRFVEAGSDDTRG
jgi:hypothetical protein